MSATPHRRFTSLLAFVIVGLLGVAAVALLTDWAKSGRSDQDSQQVEAVGSAGTVARHRLKVSSNGRYFEKSDGSPFLYIGDTEWLLNKHHNMVIDTLLDDRRKRGFTVIKIGATGLNAEYKYDRRDANGNLPFVKGDITRFNAAWWARLVSVVRKCAQRDLIVELTIGGPGRNESSLIIPPSDCQLYEYGRQVGNLLKGDSNVIFSIGQDMDPVDGVGLPGWRAIAEGVADGVNGENRHDLNANYDTTLMTFHPSGLSPHTSAASFHGDSWIDFNSIEVFHHNASVYGTVNTDYRRSPVKPTVFVEGSYEEDGYEINNPNVPIDLRYIRLEAWHAILAGSAGYVYGHKDNYAQMANIKYINSLGMQQIAVVIEFLRSREWWKFAPDQAIVSSGAGTGRARLAAVTSSDGDEAYVYYPAEASASIDLSRITKEKAVEAGWLDPRNGNIQAIGTYSNAETIKPAWPSGWEDGVLMLKAASSLTAPVIR